MTDISLSGILFRAGAIVEQCGVTDDPAGFLILCREFHLCDLAGIYIDPHGMVEVMTAADT